MARRHVRFADRDISNRLDDGRRVVAWRERSHFLCRPATKLGMYIVSRTPHDRRDDDNPSQNEPQWTPPGKTGVKNLPVRSNTAAGRAGNPNGTHEQSSKSVGIFAQNATASRGRIEIQRHTPSCIYLGTRHASACSGFPHASYIST